jgi:uncharacterized protein YbaR (Trm112 family)
MVCTPHSHVEVYVLESLESTSFPTLTPYMSVAERQVPHLTSGYRNREGGERKQMSGIKKQVDQQFATCDECNYDRGVHVSFERRDASHEVVLICPGCGRRYSINWQTTL